jgi:hypothetical protein
MKALLARIAQRVFPACTRTLINARILARGYGQARSDSSGAVNAEGKPIPWYTYPAVEYLAQFDLRARSVFEFGAGSSTRFWAARAARVCAVESDPSWHALLAAQGLPNVRLFLRTTKAEYVACLAEQGAEFDLIAIDGRWRRSCARAAAAHLATGGILVLDNSDRYPGIARELRDAGFFQIDFNGFGPMNAYTWTTSIFLRADGRLQEAFAHPAPIGGLARHEPEDD